MIITGTRHTGYYGLPNENVTRKLRLLQTVTKCNSFVTTQLFPSFVFYYTIHLYIMLFNGSIWYMMTIYCYNMKLIYRRSRRIVCDVRICTTSY